MIEFPTKTIQPKNQVDATANDAKSRSLLPKGAWGSGFKWEIGGSNRWAQDDCLVYCIIVPPFLLLAFVHVFFSISII